MPLTREFKKTTTADLQDRGYRAAYLAQAIEAMHGGEFSVGKRMLRNYINATVGFEALSKAVGCPAKSLMRILGESSEMLTRRIPKARRTIVRAIGPIPRRDLEAFAEIYVRVAAFFDNTSKTKAWFRTPNPFLGGVRPIELLLCGRAHRLLQFVEQSDACHPRAIPRLSPAWVREIERRAAHVDSGAVQAIPWAKARARLRRKSKARARRGVRP